MDQLKGSGQPLVLANQKTCPPSLFEFITLITYLFSLQLCVCLACPCACLCLPTVAHTSTVPGVLAYQHTWFCLFWISFRSFLPSHQSFSFFLPHLFFPTCFSQLPFSDWLFCVLPLLFCGPTAVRVSWTEGESVWAGKPHKIPQHHTRTQMLVTS